MPMSVDQLALARSYLADPGTSAVQSIEIDNATGGTWTITFAGQTTSALAFNAGANAVQNALAALSNIGVGNVGVNEQPGNGNIAGALFYVVYFIGVLGEVAQPLVVVSSGSLTGVGVIVTVAQLQAGGRTAFSDSELSAFYDQAVANFFLSIAYAFRALWSNAAKFNDYVAGQSQEKKSQIRQGLKELATLYEQWANADRQVQTSTLQNEPPRLRAMPRLVGTTAVSLTYQPPYGPIPWTRPGPWNW